MATSGSGVGRTSRVAAVTIAKWAKRVSEITKRKLVLYALLSKKGLIHYCDGGGQLRWPVRVEEHQIEEWVDAVPVPFTRLDTKDNAFLPWRGYRASDAITLQEKLENGGEAAIVKIFEGREKQIREAITRKFAAEFYIDGNVSTRRFHGIESFMGIGAQTDTDVEATNPSDTYANLSTVPAALSSDSDLARIWTPTIISTNRNPGTGIISWADAADEYLRAGIIRTQFGNAEEDMLDLILLTRSSYEDLLNILDNKERIMVNRGAAAGLVSMGFKAVVEIDGVPVMWDVAVPSTDANGDVVRGYGWNSSRFQLYLLGKEKQLWKVITTYNQSYQADEIFLWCYGNFQAESPKYFAKFADIATP